MEATEIVINSVFIFQDTPTISRYSQLIVNLHKPQTANTTVSVMLWSAISFLSFWHNYESLRCNTEASMTLSNKPGPSLFFPHEDYSLKSVHQGGKDGVRGQMTYYFSVRTTHPHGAHAQICLCFSLLSLLEAH